MGIGSAPASRPSRTFTRAVYGVNGVEIHCHIAWRIAAFRGLLLSPGRILVANYEFIALFNSRGRARAERPVRHGSPGPWGCASFFVEELVQSLKRTGHARMYCRRNS